ncbi:phosphate uptake regulator PhoU [halophilic archaeon]|nr:phosphate uptake regulator PhoU [halophilic archaeon]
MQLRDGRCTLEDGFLVDDVPLPDDTLALQLLEEFREVVFRESEVVGQLRLGLRCSLVYRLDDAGESRLASRLRHCMWLTPAHSSIHARQSTKVIPTVQYGPVRTSSLPMKLYLSIVFNIERKVSYQRLRIDTRVVELTMETRKVQLSGGTTFTVSLPKVWATEQDISNGSVLYLHPDDDGTLLIEAGPRQESDDRTVRLDVSTYDTEMILEAAQSMYLVGTDELVLVDRNGHDDERIAAAKDLTTKLSGLEVLETTDRRLVLRNIMDPASVSIRKSVLRLKLIVLSMHRDAVRAVTDNDPALARQVVARDDEADKLLHLVTRQFQCALEDLQTVEQLDTTRSRLFEQYHAARQFERVGDHATKIARLVVERTDDLGEIDIEEFDRLADRSRRIVERAGDVVLSDVDARTGFDILEDATELAEAVEKLDRELYDREDAAGAYVVGLLLDSVRRTAAYGRNIAEVGFQRAVLTEEAPESSC